MHRRAFSPQEPRKIRDPNFKEKSRAKSPEFVTCRFIFAPDKYRGLDSPGQDGSWTATLWPEAKLSRTFCNSAPSTLANITSKSEVIGFFAKHVEGDCGTARPRRPQLRCSGLRHRKKPRDSDRTRPQDTVPSWPPSRPTPQQRLEEVRNIPSDGTALCCVPGTNCWTRNWRTV